MQNVPTTHEEQTKSGLHISRRHLIKAGAAVGIGAWAAPVISVIGAGPASAHGTYQDHTSGNTPGDSCHPYWPCLFIFFNDYRGNCYGAYCRSGSKDFHGLDDASYKSFCGSKSWWNRQKWGNCTYGRDSYNGYGGYDRHSGSYGGGSYGGGSYGGGGYGGGWDGGWGGGYGGYTAYNYSSNYYGGSYHHDDDKDVQDFYTAKSSHCSTLKTGFKFDDKCGQPIWWRTPRGCNPPPHCDKVKVYCQDTPGGSVREISCGWDGWYKFA